MASAAKGASEKFESVQVLRGIGALLVVGIHINNWLSAWERSIGPSHIAYFANWHQFGAIGVDIFFVISGFVIALTMERYHGRTAIFLRQRYLRIAPLAYLMSALWMLRQHMTGRPVPTPGIVSTLIILPILPTFALPTLDVLWTLSFEFTLYLFVCLVLLLRLGPKTLAALLCLCGAIGLVHRFDYPMLRWATNPILFEFALGTLAFLLWRDGRTPRWAIAAGAAAGLAALLVQVAIGSGIPANPALVVSAQSSVPRVVQWALPVFLILNLLLHWKPRRTILVRFLHYVGDASYSIYLAHLFVISMLIRYLPLPPDGRWLVLFVAAVAAGFIVYELLERPLARLLASSRPKRPVQEEIATAP